MKRNDNNRRLRLKEEVKREAKREAKKEAKKEAKHEVREEFKNKGRKLVTSNNIVSTGSSSRSKLAQSKRKTTQQLAMEYAMSLIDPWCYQGVKVPTRMGARRTQTMTTVTRIAMNADSNGNIGLFVRPGVWGGMAPSSNVGGGTTGLTYRTTVADGVPYDGYCLDQWIEQDQAEVIISAASQIRPVSMGVKMEYIGVAVSATGTICAALNPPTEPYPYFDSTTSQSRPLSFDQLVDFYTAKTYPAIDGVKAIWLPYSEEVFNFRDLKPDIGFNQLSPVDRKSVV